MIISASRRTDIPAFYAEWLLGRLRAGEVLVPHPRDPSRLWRVGLGPDHVDCIVFWTKNAAPMLDKLGDIDRLGFRYYFSFTLTGYGGDLEPGLPGKDEVADTFLRLSERIGPKRVDWRFDPILLDGRYTAQWHLDTFGEMCRRLKGATGRCVVNFVKPYRHLPQIRPPEEEAARRLAAGLAAIAAEHGLPLYSCTDARDLHDLGIGHGACIDRGKIEEICGWAMDLKKDPGQPDTCRCVQSVDIGVYDTCAHGCVYCYANASRGRLERNRASHDPASPLLAGAPPPGARITDRTGPSCKRAQLALPGF